jgi:chorismate mutase
MPDTQPTADPAALRAGGNIAGLRAEIDALDDQLHDTLMRRAEVVARLAASRAKGQGPALRPGREAVILRRLLARHSGPLPRGALVRLWRELLAAMTAMQSPLPVATCLPERGWRSSGPIWAMPCRWRGWRRRGRDRSGRGGDLRPRRPAAGPMVARPRSRAPAGRGAAALPRARRPARLPPLPRRARSLGRGPQPDPAARRDAASLSATILDTEGDLALVEVEGFLAAGDPRLPPGATPLGAYATPVLS